MTTTSNIDNAEAQAPAIDYFGFSLAAALGVEKPASADAQVLICLNLLPIDADKHAEAISDAGRFCSALENAAKENPEIAEKWLKETAIPGIWNAVLFFTGYPRNLIEKQGVL
jgi:hypothetical protein